MQYVLLDIGYQEVLNGQVVRYTDLDGNTIPNPVGYGGTVVDANPPAPAWAQPDPAAEQPVATQASRQITVIAFRKRFSPDEKRRIYSAAEVNVDIRIWLDDLASVQDQMVDLDDPETQIGVRSLEAAGLLDAAGRADEILNA